MINTQHPWEVFGALGATTTILKTKLFLSSETRFDVHDHGIPNDALILNITSSPRDMFCFNLAREDDPRLQLYGFATFAIKDRVPAESTVDVAVTWVKSSDSDFAWNNLAGAFKHYGHEQYRDAIIPANVAVESKLYALLSRTLDLSAGRGRVKDFLENAATYSHQLNVLLPYISAIHNIPQLDDTVRGLLNRLRGCRNDLAHRGRTEPDISQESCAEYLAAAAFAFRYLEYFDSHD